MNRTAPLAEASPLTWIIANVSDAELWGIQPTAADAKDTHANPTPAGGAPAIPAPTAAAAASAANAAAADDETATTTTTSDRPTDPKAAEKWARGKLFGALGNRTVAAAGPAMVIKRGEDPEIFSGSWKRAALSDWAFKAQFSSVERITPGRGRSAVHHSHSPHILKPSPRLHSTHRFTSPSPPMNGPMNGPTIGPIIGPMDQMYGPIIGPMDQMYERMNRRRMCMPPQLFKT